MGENQFFKLKDNEVSGQKFYLGQHDFLERMTKNKLQFNHEWLLFSTKLENVSITGNTGLLNILWPTFSLLKWQKLNPIRFLRVFLTLVALLAFFSALILSVRIIWNKMNTKNLKKRLKIFYRYISDHSSRNRDFHHWMEKT